MITEAIGVSAILLLVDCGQSRADLAAWKRIVLETYKQYLSELDEALKSLDPSELERATEIIARAFQADRTVFVAGNGGSAATASHLACDFSKTTLGKDPVSARRRLRTIAL